MLCFNTQPPEGGWAIVPILSAVSDVSTHSHPKAAGRRPARAEWSAACFNTQPPEGGWICPRAFQAVAASFNTQPPEGGWVHRTPHRPQQPRFNTQPPEGGWGCLCLIEWPEMGFNTQPPEGGWGNIMAIPITESVFQHTATRRRLEPLSKALLHQVSQPRVR